jgi:hypothetical protein
MKSLQSRRVFWAKHIEQWQVSGLTQVAYCQLHSLKTKAFGYRVRIHERASDTLTLVPIKVSKPIGTTEVLLRHANGWQLVLSPSVEPAWLARLLREMV